MWWLLCVRVKEVRAVEQPDLPQGQGCHHLRSLWKDEKQWCFNSNSSRTHASCRQQVTVILRKLIESWCRIEDLSNPKTSSNRLHGLQHNTVANNMIRFSISVPSLLHYIVFWIIAGKIAKMIYFSVCQCEVKQLNSYIFRSNLSSVFGKPPREMSLCYWPLLNMKNRSAYRPDYANTESVPRMGDNLNLHNFLNVYFLFGW